MLRNGRPADLWRATTTARALSLFFTQPRFAAVALAMPLAPHIGLAGTFLVIVIACTAATWVIHRLTGNEWVRLRLRGAHPMLSQVPSFGLAVAMRVIDIVAWTIRMVCVAAILGAPLSMSQAALLGLADERLGDGNELAVGRGHQGLRGSNSRPNSPAGRLRGFEGTKRLPFVLHAPN